MPRSPRCRAPRRETAAPPTGPEASHRVVNLAVMLVVLAGGRSYTEPAAALGGPGAGAWGPIGQAGELQPSPQSIGIGEVRQSGDCCQRESGDCCQRAQHSQARRERGGHRPRAQPQQAPAQAHQRQHGHPGTSVGELGAAPARYATGSPAGAAHIAGDKPRAIPGPLPCLTRPVPGASAVDGATARPAGLAATGPPAVAAWAARVPLLPPAAVHPARRTAIAPSSAPARADSALACEVVITPPATAQVVQI